MVKIIRTFKKGRICKFKGCKCVLSIYNSATYCHLHQRSVISKRIPAAPITLQ